MEKDKKNFGLYPKKGQPRSLVSQLMKRPKKDSRINMPSRNSKFIEPGYVHQADVLFLPDDNGYKYALVVVDLGSKLVDAEPLMSKKPTDIVGAFEKIYKRPYLSIPKALLQVDDGGEFKGAVTKYFRDHNVMIRRGRPGRHRQIATVEAYIGVIARAIFYALHTQEIKTKKVATSWVNNLPKIIKIINKKKSAEKKREKVTSKDLAGRCEGISCELLKVGDRVRVQLDRPRDATGNLPGKFRITDLRWENKERKITAIILHPGQPPLYRVSGLKNVLYTRNQLQLISND